VDDLDAIMQLETSTFVSDAWSADSMRAELVNANTYYLVAVRADGADRADGAVRADGADSAAVDGYAGLLAPPGAKEADIQTIAVAESARRNGIGRGLVAALMKEAATRGASEVFLEVRADNPGAQALYRSFGFEEIAVRPRYYQPDDVDAIVMRAAEPRASRSDAATLPTGTAVRRFASCGTGGVDPAPNEPASEGTVEDQA
jgi:ribosomal-protein-alanine acetyltransferase